MSTNYVTGALFALLGGFLIVVSQTFTSALLGWVAFGVAVAVAAVSVLAQLDRSRGGVQRTLDGASIIVATLLIIFSLAASGTAVIWLSFAFALGVVALAFTGLSVHEVSNWRIRHQLSNLRWLHEGPVVAGSSQSRAA
jgi:ABC-type transport system involved in multi-copper enzyme maturation permease subunit